MLFDIGLGGGMRSTECNSSLCFNSVDLRLGGCTATARDQGEKYGAEYDSIINTNNITIPCYQCMTISSCNTYKAHCCWLYQNDLRPPEAWQSHFFLLRYFTLLFALMLPYEKKKELDLRTVFVVA